MRLAMLAMLLAGDIRPAAVGCDLGRVVGYTLVASKVVEAYIEDGSRVDGFTGCTTDRVLVFTDHTGVRCKETAVQIAHLPTAYLFARDRNDMKLCVGDDMYNVAQAN